MRQNARGTNCVGSSMTVSHMIRNMWTNSFFRMIDTPLRRRTVSKENWFITLNCFLKLEKSAFYLSYFEKQQATNQVWTGSAGGKKNLNENNPKSYLPSAIHILWENVHMQQRNNWGKTIWGFKGQMLTLKRCPYSNEAPGAMFWSERLKRVQWIAQPATSHILKVTLFKKGSQSQIEGLLGLHATYSSSAFSQSARP